MALRRPPLEDGGFVPLFCCNWPSLALRFSPSRAGRRGDGELWAQHDRHGRTADFLGMPTNETIIRWARALLDMA